MPPYYDSLIAKLIVHATTGRIVWHGSNERSEFIVEPIPTTLALHERLVDAPAVLDGSYNIRWLEEHPTDD